MKKIFLIFIISILVNSPTYSSEYLCKFTGFNCPKVEYKDLIKKNKIYFKKFTDNPFTGNVIGQYQGKIISGKRDGNWKVYWTNGFLGKEGNYKNGEKNGLWKEYHSNGLIYYEQLYQDGKLNGISKQYFKNGKVEVKETYKNGKLHGKKTFFFQNGKEQGFLHYKEGILHGKFLTFYSNNQFESIGKYSNGKREGEILWFDVKGKLKDYMSGYFKNDKRIRKNKKELIERYENFNNNI